MDKYTECHNCENKSDCERTYLGGCTDGAEKKLTDEDVRLIRLDIIAQKASSDFEHFAYVPKSKMEKWLAFIEKLNKELKKELAEHEEFTKKAKEEIERLTEENDHLDMVAKQALADYQNAQVQVDELKANQVIECHGMLKGCDMVKQAVKDTAKEIWDIVMSDECSVENTFDDTKFTQIIKERYGVEVE